ncbi:MAG: hypothetical protein ABSD29_00925 [Verrucomicrobiota bacterium]
MRLRLAGPGWLGLAAVMLTMLAGGALLAADDAGIDPVRGRALMEKWQRGEALTPEESAYLDRVRAEIRRRTAQKRAANQPTGTNAPAVQADWSRLVPLTDLTNTYKGQDGGLYGGGKNEPPAAHRSAWLKACAQVQPLGAGGHPARDGKIVLLTVGFSNTHLESEDFVRTGSAAPQKAPSVVLVDGAIGGRAAVMWAYDGSDRLPQAEQERLDHEMDVVHMAKTHRGGRRVPEEKDTWPTVELRLKEAGVTPAQVQAVWMKHVEAGAAALGEFPAHAKALEADLADILVIAKQRFPNLRVAFFSSRTYGGWARPTAGSPEPYAYETGFAVRWLVQRQINGDPGLNWNPARGEVKAPVAVWGPYLWACGDRPRKTDGLVWTEQDVRSNDHMHPSEAGCRKVTEQLLKFLKTDPGARLWFLKPGA